MIYERLGSTQFMISKICFGSLTIGPLQANLTVPDGAYVIKTALNQGINFIDTAEIYNNYAYIREALKGWNKDVIVASKSYAYTAELMAESLETARKELNRDIIDIFLLHEQESALTIKGHWPAMEYLLEQKSKGKVGAVGISTHAVSAVEAAMDINEIDVIHPMLNMKGLGIIDGNISQMLQAVKTASEKGKGIYGMKAIAGGNLIGQVEQALKWAFNLKFVNSVAVGMKSPAEVEVNIAWLKGENPDLGNLKQISSEQRNLHIEEWCIGCGKCVNACGQRAMSIINEKASVDKDRCVLCGYCGAVCRDFCIKII